MKILRPSSILLITLFLFTGNLSAGDNHEKSELDPFIQLMLEQVSFMEGRITSLAEAIPEDKYSWKPAEGVKSTSEQLVHVIIAAYFMPSMMGAEMPSHINWEIEKTMTAKDEILKNLKESFAAAVKFLKSYDPDNFEKIVEAPFGEFTQRSLILNINNHYHEHLGQLIVYARSNDVVPPWSRKKEE